MKKNETPDEKYERADTDPGIAYELGRKDGWNAAIDEVTAEKVKAMLDEQIKKADEARAKEMNRQLWKGKYDTFQSDTIGI